MSNIGKQNVAMGKYIQYKGLIKVNDFGLTTSVALIALERSKLVLSA